MTDTDFTIRQISNEKCECDWCGHDNLRPEDADGTIFFITPDDRCICDACVDQNDWTLTAPSGLMMWQYCQAIQLSWVDRGPTD